MSYVKDMEEDLKSARPERVFITHSGCDRTTVDAVRSYQSLGIFHEILETRPAVLFPATAVPDTWCSVYCKINDYTGYFVMFYEVHINL